MITARYEIPAEGDTPFIIEYQLGCKDPDVKIHIATDRSVIVSVEYLSLVIDAIKAAQHTEETDNA